MIDRATAQRQFQENLASLRADIVRACQQAGRPSDSVKLIAVTKYVDVVQTRWLAEIGCLALGENRADQLRDKVPLMADLPIEWHFIGHLQRNKIKWVIPHASLIHSVDSLRLLESLNEHAEQLGRPCSILLEANISGDSSKHGFALGELAAAIRHGMALPHVRVKGLMGMSGLGASPQEIRDQFKRLADQWRAVQTWATEKDPLRELSIGMSDDFELAIAAGSTMIRVGSRLFHGVLERSTP